LIKANPDASVWFDPFITTEIVTTNDLCQALNSIFTQMRSRGQASLEKVAIYTYVLLFQIHLNGMEELIFERCVDSRMF
jgi:hypothetical protein